MLILLLLVSLQACESIAIDTTCQNVSYEEEIAVKLNETICFPENRSITITSIKHQFCPCEVICDYEGDLFFTLSFNSSSNSGLKEFLPIHLDTDPTIFESYKITNFDYLYEDNNGEVPACAQDFEAEKVLVKFTISKK